ncbi:hypothetical protein [Streptomyces sp. NPDC088757]|uniref:hypothetical protein n=1 Tax=Streptomyces sp. NPDC088757 TaxID=3365889 RepID=UPI00380E4A0E
MQKMTAYGFIAAGVVLLILYVSEIITTVPYSIFAILAGTGFIFEGIRRVIQLRRVQEQ